jgi:hypothetical protein
MKKITFILIFFILGLASCEDNSPVKPKTDVSQKQGDTVKTINDGPGS